jgi:hypothetical protein
MLWKIILYTYLTGVIAELLLIVSFSDELTIKEIFYCFAAAPLRLALMLVGLLTSWVWFVEGFVGKDRDFVLFRWRKK